MRILYRIRAYHHAADGTWFSGSTDRNKESTSDREKYAGRGHDESSETGRRRPEKRIRCYDCGYEEKQKVPEGTAQRRGIRRNCRILCRQNVIGVKTGSLSDDFNLVVLYKKHGKEFLICSLGSQSNYSRYDDVNYVLKTIDESDYLKK